MKNTTITAEPASRRQPISADEAATLRAEYGENAPPAMHMCLCRSGRVDGLRLTAGDIDQADIAHGLALTNRWNGATREGVSVAWHSLVVSALASEIDPAAALHGLMHDADEACTGDWTRPYKLHLGPMLTELAERIEHACLEAAGITEPTATSRAVKEADEAVLLLEHTSRWGMGQQMRGEDAGRVARARAAVRRVNPDGAGCAKRSGQAREPGRRRLREAHHRERTPEDAPARKALELEQYRNEWACTLSRNIHASLDSAEEHAARNGFTKNRSLTYVGHYGYGDIFNARTVRLRVTHEETGEVRRYVIDYKTGEAELEVHRYGWHTEEHFLAQEAEHEALCNELDRCSDEDLTALFGRGNEPRREYLRRSRDVEHPYRREDWPPEDTGGGTNA